MTESTPVRRLLACALAIAVVAAPVLAQTSEVEEARSAAKADAKRDVSWFPWFAAGCILNVIGVGVSYFVTSTPQTSRLLGKSSEYVDAYTKAYRSAVRSSRVTYASIGCCVMTTAAAVAVALAVMYGASQAAVACLEATSDPY